MLSVFQELAAVALTPTPALAGIDSETAKTKTRAIIINRLVRLTKFFIIFKNYFLYRNLFIQFVPSSPALTSSEPVELAKLKREGWKFSDTLSTS